MSDRDLIQKACVGLSTKMAQHPAVLVITSTVRSIFIDVMNCGEYQNQLSRINTKVFSGTNIKPLAFVYSASSLHVQFCVNDIHYQATLKEFIMNVSCHDYFEMILGEGYYSLVDDPDPYLIEYGSKLEQTEINMNTELNSEYSHYGRW